MHRSLISIALSVGLLCPPSAWAGPRPSPAVQARIARFARRYQRAIPKHASDDTLRRRAQRSAAADKLLDVDSAAANHALENLSKREPNPALFKYVVGGLYGAVKSVPKRAEPLVARAFPKQPAIPRTGTIEVRQYVGDEFFRSAVALLRKDKFNVRVNGRTVEAQRGRLHVVLRGTDDAILRDMSDPKVHVVLFTGHSDVGGVFERGLAAARAQKGNKLILGLGCITEQTTPETSGMYNEAQLIFTRNPSNDIDDKNLISALYHGLPLNWGFAKIRGYARRGGDVTNYVFPDQMEKSRQAWDLNRDGQVDFHGTRRLDQGFEVVDGRRRFPGLKVLSAVRYLNNSNRYYVEDTAEHLFRRRDVHERFRSGGVAEQPFDADRMVMFKPGQQDGRRVVDVLLNPLHAKGPRAFVAATSVYEMELNLARSRYHKVTDDHRALALLMATDDLWRLNGSWEQVDTAVKKLVRFEKLPKLSYDELENIVLMGGAKLIGTDAQIGAVKKLLEARKVAGR